MFEVLRRHGVGFVLIGGIAAQVRGSPTGTRDLDICYERSDENHERLAAALRDLGARLRGRGVPDDVSFRIDGKTLAMGDSFTFMTDVGPLDVLGTPSGTGGFGELASTASRVDFGGVEVLVASLDDLIRMKRAAGRPKDRVELEILGALRDELEERRPD